jgi:hypothetical protein
MVCIKGIKNQEGKTIATVGNIYDMVTIQMNSDSILSFDIFSYCYFRGNDGISYTYIPSYFKTIDEVRQEKLEQLGI